MCHTHFSLRAGPLYLRSALAASIVLLIYPSAAAAQFRAGIQGTVQDTTGAVLTRVTVIVTNTETGRTDEAVTSRQGFYAVAGLPPGTYSVRATLAGFKTSIADNVIVRAETTRAVNLTLEPGDAAETVTVTATAGVPMLQTESASVVGTISELQVRRLPQMGRDPYELVRIAPGVFGDGARRATGDTDGFPYVIGSFSLLPPNEQINWFWALGPGVFGFPSVARFRTGGSNASIFQPENQAQISASGQRVSANNFTIDGASANSLGFAGAAVVTPNQESVKEITVVASSYSAEDGRNSGALIKVVSRSGTNMLRGSALFKYNDPALNARNKYGGLDDAPRVKVDLRHRQHAGSLGGPILRDRAFFFGSFEGLRHNLSTVANAYVETPEFRELVRRLRPNGVTASILGAPGIEPRVRTVLPAGCEAFRSLPCQVLPGGLDFGSPTGSPGSPRFGAGSPLDGIPDVQLALIDLPNLVRGRQYTARLDYQRGQNRYAVSTYFTRRNDESSDGSAQGRPMADLVFTPLNSLATLIHNRVLSPTMLNEARFSVTGFAADQVAASKKTDFGIPRVQVHTFLSEAIPISGGTLFMPVEPFDNPIAFGAPREETSPAVFAQRTYEVRDIVTKIFGSQSVKIGGEIRWEHDNSSLVGGARPLYNFAGLFDLANDAPVSAAINVDPRTGAPAVTQRHFRTSYYGVFVQDDWKLRPTLTLNLGLRYEYFTPLTEKDGLLTNVQLGPQGLADARVVSVERLHDPDRNNFAPRVGMAWSPGRFSSKLVLRGGFGVSYNRTPGVLFTNVRANPPFLVRQSLPSWSLGYVRGASRSPSSFPVNSSRAEGVDSATGVPFGHFGVIWGTPPKFPNAYVYRYSVEGQYQIAPRLVAALGYTGSASRKLIRIVSQNDIFLGQWNHPFHSVYFPTPDTDAHYNAVELRLTRELADGLRIEGSYRWSKSVDALSYEGPGVRRVNPTCTPSIEVLKIVECVESGPIARDPESETGPSDYDARHFFVLTGLWDLPFAQGRRDAVGKIAGGWQVSGILTAHSGFPWTPRHEWDDFPGDVYFARQVRQGTQNPTNQDFIDGIFPGGGWTYFGATTPGPRIARNAQRGPRYLSVDMTFGKRTGLVGRADLDLRANVFNVFNTLNLTPFSFFSRGVFIRDRNFGRVDGALAGRVVELQARFSF